MRCPLCGYEFREDDGNNACRGCPLARACRMVKCPHCGYDIPAEPRLIKTFKTWRKQGVG